MILMITISCNHCGGQNHVPEHYADKIIKCSSCLAPLKAPPLAAVASTSKSSPSIARIALFLGLCGAIFIFVFLNNKPAIETKEPGQILLTTNVIMSVNPFTVNGETKTNKLKLTVYAYANGEKSYDITGNTDSTTAREYQGKYAKILPPINASTEKYGEVLTFLRKMDEWKRLAIENNLTNSSKDFTDNPWNVKMNFYTIEESNGIKAFFSAGGLPVPIGVSDPIWYDTIEIRALLTKLGSCMDEANKQLKSSSENSERDLQLQQKAEELFK